MAFREFGFEHTARRDMVGVRVAPPIACLAHRMHVPPGQRARIRLGDGEGEVEGEGEVR